VADRVVLHVDMDAFYASVEQRDAPDLRGKPVVVGGAERGVVAAASYEARRFGIRSAMPMSEALRRCPALVRVKPRMSHYRAVSRDVFAVFRAFTPLVEGLSLDEAFLDVTSSLGLFGDGETIARTIKAQILERTQLTASVGVAGNKLVAKIASDLDKPDGLVVVWPDDARERLAPLPVAVIPGIGPRTVARLEEHGIRTVGDLQQAPDRALDAVFGRFALRTRERAAGIDSRPVVPHREEKSVSAEETFFEDLTETADMDRELLRLAERTAARLHKKSLVAGTLQVKIRESDFTTCTRQQALTPPGNRTDALYAAARTLLHGWLAENPGARIRLLGVGGTRLAPARQGDLFDTASDAVAPVDDAVQRVRGRFGDTALTRARGLRLRRGQSRE